jgi:hypothetical protein
VFDLTGNSFGHLTVLGKVGSRSGKSLWKCMCDYGTVSFALTHNLRKGTTQSCGCRKGVRHGFRNAPEYHAYYDAKRRCTKPKYCSYHRYGGRGIKFLFKSFRQFYDELGKRPNGLTLDRMDNDGNYEPGNVRWATRKEQARNPYPRH